MLYDLASDLHIDLQGISNWDKALKVIDWSAVRNPGSRVLVVAGDTANAGRKTITALKLAAPHYEWVVFVDGNHEHYDTKKHRKTIKTEMLYLRDQALEVPNLIYLDGKNELLLDGTLFIGICGWYDFRFGEPDVGFQRQREVWLEESNDRNWVGFHQFPEEIAAEHAKVLSYSVANAQTRDDVKEIVVVTHTVPNKRGTPYKPGDFEWNALNGAYGNFRMAEVVANDSKRKIKNWVFGHTHYPNDFDEGGVRYISRPRGYHNRNDLCQEWDGPLQIDTEAAQSAFGEVIR